MPGRVIHSAIVIDGNRNSLVANLRFAREEHFRHISHAHQVASRLPREVAFRTRTQPRPLYAGIGHARMKPQAQRLSMPRNPFRLALTGVAVEMWVAMPSPKKVEIRFPSVQSKY
jgi:DNA-binding cell septation regulator SpoVG